MRRSFVDQVLGAMPWDEERGGWVAQPPQSKVRVIVNGAEEPDARLLAHARTLGANPTEFFAQVVSLQRAFADRVPEAAAEVLALQIDAVHLMWADRPGDGMVYFAGTDPFRVWRCDYIDGRPQELGFDD